MKSTQRLTRIAALVAFLAILAFIIVGAVFHWAWAGFDKPLYDWMQLLIIPIALALIAIYFNRIDKMNEQSIARDNQQEIALQGYLDRISELLLEKDLRISQPDAEVRTVARARTLTVLPLLNARRKESIIVFLYESHLINIVDLSDADLNEVDLRFTNLNNTKLRFANLSKANLYQANLSGADLHGANLSGAILLVSKLSEADLSEANLSGATIDQSSLDKAHVTNEQRATLKIVSP